MKKDRPNWNKNKKEQFASLKNIREANELIRLLKSSFTKDDSRISILANNVSLGMKDKKDNQRELFKELKRNNVVVKYMKQLHSPNNIYKVIMNHINDSKK